MSNSVCQDFPKPLGSKMISQPNKALWIRTIHLALLRGQLEKSTPSYIRLWHNSVFSLKALIILHAMMGRY